MATSVLSAEQPAVLSAAKVRLADVYLDKLDNLATTLGNPQLVQERMNAKRRKRPWASSADASNFPKNGRANARPVSIRKANSSTGQIIEWRGKTLSMGVDNGPEYVSSTLMTWAERQGIAVTQIRPGKPQQNAYVERYNRMAMDLQKRTPQHGHKRDHPRHEAENGRVSSTAAPR